jgi:hypothetical protein
MAWYSEGFIRKEKRDIEKKLYQTYITSETEVTEAMIHTAFERYEADNGKPRYYGEAKRRIIQQFNTEFQLCKRIARRVYESYIDKESEITEEKIEQAIEKYEITNEESLEEWRTYIVKALIQKKDFKLADWYIEAFKKSRREREIQRKCTEGMKTAQEEYFSTTKKIIEALKEEILSDKVFCAKIIVYTQTLNLQKKKRYFKRLLEKENRQDDTFASFEEISPKDFLDFKEEQVERFFNDYKERKKPELKDGWEVRIKKEILCFMKTINGGDENEYI